MAVFSPRKTSQLLGTGILLVLASVCIFVVVFLTYRAELKLEEQNLLRHKGEFWSSIPVLLTGFLGIIAGRAKKAWLVSCYLVGCITSLVLGTLASVQAGIMVLALRNTCDENDSACRNSTVATLMSSVVLVGALLVCMSTWGGVVACQVKWGPSQHTKRLAAAGRNARGVAQPVGTGLPFADNAGYVDECSPGSPPKSLSNHQSPREAVTTDLSSAAQEGHFSSDGLSTVPLSEERAPDSPSEGDGEPAVPENEKQILVPSKCVTVTDEEESKEGDLGTENSTFQDQRGESTQL